MRDISPAYEPDSYKQPNYQDQGPVSDYGYDPHSDDPDHDRDECPVCSAEDDR